MRIAALILIVLGVIAFAVPSVTFFTRERVADVGFFAIDVQKPHTIILNPGVGLVAIAAGVLILFASKGRGAGA